MRAFYTATGKAKLEDLRFHELRHTFASRLVQAGVDICTVQKLGRWKAISDVDAVCSSLSGKPAARDTGLGQGTGKV